MTEVASFITRARTVDHLGREQIADTPTAISELWKNAYDAYARTVALHIFDDEIPVAAMVDTGHGMTKKDFIEKWLVIGTDSKATNETPNKVDMDGLEPRPKQGQKGIGRLSNAILGPLLLLVSKKTDSPFVASLIDWRLFENPFLNLNDLKVPIIEFDKPEELKSQLPFMFDALMNNIWGPEEDSDRKERIVLAWKSFDLLEKTQNKDPKVEISTTREKIESTIIDSSFNDRHFNTWPVWNGSSYKGTALFTAEINDDLIAQLDRNDTNPLSEDAKQNLFGTLSQFTDHFIKQKGIKESDFHYSVTCWHDHLSKLIISPEKEFNYNHFELLEHAVIGSFDELGVFHGTIKSFNKDLINLKIPPSFKIPTHASSKVGNFNIAIGSYEYQKQNSTLDDAIHAQIKDQSDRYSGTKMYRDGLRVMPFGREGIDFFKLEMRRSQNAGLYHYSHRNIFGRVAITREQNPNLRDKAGREGIIDNTAAKAFRDLVIDVLIYVAKHYIGRESDLRKELLPLLNAEHKARKAEEDRKKKRASARKQFRGKLKKFSPKIKDLHNDTIQLSEAFKRNIETENEVIQLQEKAAIISNRLFDLKLTNAPSTLGTLEDSYREFRDNFQETQLLLNDIKETLHNKLEIIKPKAPEDIAHSTLQSNATTLHQRLRVWKRDINDILDSEKARINELVGEYNKAYHNEMLPLISDVSENKMTLSNAIKALDLEKDKLLETYEESFEPYLSALNSLKESIDLEGLATISYEEADRLRSELDRLNSLAQLGITVEIIGHEMESLDHTISRSLNSFPNDVKELSAYKTTKESQKALSDRLRFLSPLKLSGDNEKRWISGDEIYNYVKQFFGPALEESKIEFHAAKGFREFSVYDEPSRIYPVFINLVNNSRYWVSQNNNPEKQIILSEINKKIIISDSGLGVDEDDIKFLFTIFFTKKARGGRGVGLYLSKVNLAASGHKINYEVEKKYQLLDGANFAIDFKDAKYAES